VNVATIFTNFFDPSHGFEILARWFHVMAGITWIGLLYFFNFVQTPAFASMTPEVRSEALDKITWRALWWFRFAAALTFATGILILGVQKALGSNFADYFAAPQGLSIATGAIFATVMFLNVWLVIWPNQQIVIGSARQVIAGGEADPRVADAGKKGARASRANTFFSIPMVWFMVFTSHFSPFYGYPGIVSKLVYWILFLALLVFVEANALGKVGGYDSPFNKAVFDQHRTTIIGGFAAWAVLFIVGWEIILR
jgi:uncharacterized membrane protein